MFKHTSTTLQTFSTCAAAPTSSPLKPPTALLLSFVVTTAHFMLPHLAVIPLNHTVSTTGQLSLSALCLSLSRTIWLTSPSYAVFCLVVPHDSNAGAHTGGPLTEAHKTIQFIWYKWDLPSLWNLLQQAFCLLWRFRRVERRWGSKKKNRRRRWWWKRRRRRRELAELWEPWKQTNSVCVGDIISPSWGSLIPPANTKLWTRPTHCSGLPPDGLVVGPVLGPEYLSSDVERAITGQLKPGKVYAANQDLHQLIIRTTQPICLWGPHRDARSTRQGGGIASGLQWGAPSTDVFDVLYCLLLHQHKAVFVCRVYSAAQYQRSLDCKISSVSDHRPTWGNVIWVTWGD